MSGSRSGWRVIRDQATPDLTVPSLLRLLGIVRLKSEERLTNFGNASRSCQVSKLLLRTDAPQAARSAAQRICDEYVVK
jgi:hypothetical protein